MKRARSINRARKRGHIVDMWGMYLPTHYNNRKNTCVRGHNSRVKYKLYGKISNADIEYMKQLVLEQVKDTSND